MIGKTFVSHICIDVVHYLKLLQQWTADYLATEKIGFRDKRLGFGALLWKTRRTNRWGNVLQIRFRTWIEREGRKWWKEWIESAKCKPLPALQTRRLFWTHLWPGFGAESAAAGLSLILLLIYSREQRLKLNSKAHCIRSSCFPSLPLLKGQSRESSTQCHWMGEQKA